MKKNKSQWKFKFYFILSFLIYQLFLFRANGAQPELKLWYKQPAINWMTSALPIGNGSLGGMFFGGVQTEQIQFNEKTLWTGSTTSRGSYQNFGNLFLSFPNHTSSSDYIRELNIDEAIGRVSYKTGNIDYLREYFASNPDSVLVMHISAPGNIGKLTFDINLTDAHTGIKKFNGNRITMSGKLDLISYEAQIIVLNEGGTLSTVSDKISISNADAVTIILTGATNFNPNTVAYFSGSDTDLHNRITSRINKASAKSYTSLKEIHLNDYQPKFNRVKLDFATQMPSIPTDELVAFYNMHPYLDILYFQYGRYLMLSSSRGVELPSNLQGIWNNSNTPSWRSDIHSNINVQMNYWPAENTNLSECHLPFTNYISTEAQKNGGSWKNMASSLNCKGWTLKTQNNIYGYSDWEWNRPANAWYSMHLWQHYAYTLDMDYLINKAFPAMKSACVFWFDRLTKDLSGKWVAPSEWSPENGPTENGVAYAQQLIWELFTQTLKTAKIINDDPVFISQLTDKLANLDNGVKIGSWGQIREWKLTNDVQGDQHRHISQLIALYPGNQISYLTDSLYANAAKKTLISRGDGGTGWSRAWKISCWARLFDGNHAYNLLKSALSLSTVTSIDMTNNGGVYENLFDAHPPFQIDGNFGATAGITEMLLQSNQGFIHLLPALPSAWPNGSYSGLKAINNFTVDLSWKSGFVQQAIILSGSGKTCQLYYPSIKVKSIIDENGLNVDFIQKDKNRIEFTTSAQKTYALTFNNSETNIIELIPYIQLDNNDKVQTSSVENNQGHSVLLSPVSTIDGVWSWK